LNARELRLRSVTEGETEYAISAVTHSAGVEMTEALVILENSKYVPFSIPNIHTLAGIL
jgi:hypothetical protein